MKKYTLLVKTLEENYEHLISMMRMLLGNHVEVIQLKDMLQIIHSFEQPDLIRQTIQSLEDDLNTTISTYQGIFEPKMVELIKPIFLKSRYGHYDFKSVLEYANSIDRSSDILDYILEGTGVTREIIIEMANHDMNVSQTATVLYIHRNTLLYKIEQLKLLKDFDLKNFNDLFILNKLLKA